MGITSIETLSSIRDLEIDEKTGEVMYSRKEGLKKGRWFTSFSSAKKGVTEFWSDQKRVATYALNLVKSQKLRGVQ